MTVYLLVQIDEYPYSSDMQTPLCVFLSDVLAEAERDRLCDKAKNRRTGRRYFEVEEMDVADAP